MARDPYSQRQRYYDYGYIPRYDPPAPKPKTDTQRARDVLVAIAEDRTQDTGNRIVAASKLLP